jgi:hypothetical protein
MCNESEALRLSLIYPFSRAEILEAFGAVQNWKVIAQACENATACAMSLKAMALFLRPKA